MPAMWPYSGKNTAENSIRRSVISCRLKRVFVRFPPSLRPLFNVELKNFKAASVVLLSVVISLCQG